MLVGFIFGNALIPWVLAVLVASLLVVVVLTAQSCDKSRRSRFFFQRREATQKLQNYALLTVALTVAVSLITAYGFAPSKNNDPLVKIIANGKPVGVNETSQRNGGKRVVQANPEPTPLAVRANQLVPPPFKPTAVPELPPEYREISPSAEYDEAMTFKNIVFSQKIDGRKRPVTPSAQFPEGEYTLYATFDYVNLKKGMSWAWVLRRDDKIITGNEASWELGYNGPGYIYFTPIAGFSEGVYTLEMWLNGKLVSQTPFDIYSNVAR